MPFAKVNDLNLYYEIHGQGPRLCFISGTGGDLRNQPNVFQSSLSKYFEVLSFDQRGLGQSAKPERDYRMADYADDAAALLEHLGWSDVPVMGVSFGGMVAQELIAGYPRLVSRAVLACTSSGGVGGASYPLHELTNLDPIVRAERHLQAADTRRTEQWRSAHAEKWASLITLALNSQHPDKDQAGANRQLMARSYHNTWSRLREFDLPVLLAAGQFDGIAPLANMQAMKQQIANSQLRIYKGGHLFLVQDKTAYPDIIDWLSGKL